MFRLVSLFTFVCLLASSKQALSRVILEDTSGQTDFLVEEVYAGLSVPWGMAFLNTDELLITERQGKLYYLNIKTKQLTLITGTPSVLAQGQGGLLDIAIAPKKNEQGNPILYFSYSKPLNNTGTTALGSAHLIGKKSLTNWRDIFIAKSNSTTSRHYGSRIAFDNEGHIFLSIGDRGIRKDAQELDNHSGTIIRLNLDGTIPEDNPFLKQKRALPEIWSYGHRNPQGLAFNTDKSQLWSIEHGPRGGDEINLIKPGKNYGWPVISYGKEYWGPISVGEGTHKTGMEQPVKYYVPSIAPGSLLVYSGKAFKEWEGDLFAGALKLTHLNQVKLDQHNQAIKETRLLQELGERIRALAESPEGWIYLSTDSGKILRLRKK